MFAWFFAVLSFPFLFCSHFHHQHNRSNRRISSNLASRKRIRRVFLFTYFTRCFGFVSFSMCISQQKILLICVSMKRETNKLFMKLKIKRSFSIRFQIDQLCLFFRTSIVCWSEWEIEFYLLRWNNWSNGISPWENLVYRYCDISASWYSFWIVRKILGNFIRLFSIFRMYCPNQTIARRSWHTTTIYTMLVSTYWSVSNLFRSSPIQARQGEFYSLLIEWLIVLDQ